MTIRQNKYNKIKKRCKNAGIFISIGIIGLIIMGIFTCIQFIIPCYHIKSTLFELNGNYFCSSTDTKLGLYYIFWGIIGNYIVLYLIFCISEYDNSIITMICTLFNIGLNSIFPCLFVYDHSLQNNIYLVRNNTEIYIGNLILIILSHNIINILILIGLFIRSIVYNK